MKYVKRGLESGIATLISEHQQLFVLLFVQGYFLLRFLASEVGEQEFIDFLRMFVRKYHGHLILSQVRVFRYNSVLL